jgi:hypothetical protein
VIEVTNLLPTSEQIETALRLARGEWQKFVIKHGYAILGGYAAHWSGRYTRSFYRLCRRLREAGVEARAFVDKGRFTYYLLIGNEWTKLIDRVEAVMSPARIIYAQLEGRKFSAETEKVLRKLKLRKKLRSFIARCRMTLIAIGDDYGNSLRGYYNPEEAYSKLVPLIEEVERVWDEMKDWIGILLL